MTQAYPQTMKARTAPRLLAFFAFNLASLALISGCAAGPNEMIDPEITIRTPLGTSSVQGDVTFEIETRGRFDGNVTLLVGETTLHEWEPGGTLSLAVDTTAFPDDVYVFEARGQALDSGAISDSVALTVNNSGPTLELVEPRLPDVYLEDGAFPFVVSAEDIVGVDRVMLFIDDVMVEEWVSPTSTTLSVNFDPASLGTDTREIFVRVEAVDREGVSSETGRSFGILRRELWTNFIDAADFGPVILPNKSVVVATQSRLAIFDEFGASVCSVPSPTGATSAALLALPEDNVAYWGTVMGVHVVSLEDCSLVSSPATGIITGMARQSGAVATVTFRGVLRLHTAATGEVTSELDLGTLAVGEVVMDHDGVAFAPDGTLYVAGEVGTAGGLFVQPPMGEMAFFVVAEPVQGGIAVDAEGAFLTGSQGNVFRYDGMGALLWRRPAELSVGRSIQSTPILGFDALIVADGASTIHALDIETGESRWTHNVGADTTITRAGAGTDGARRYYAVGDALGGVTVLDREGALHFQSFVSLGGDPAAVNGIPAVGTDRVAVIDEDGLLVVYSL